MSKYENKGGYSIITREKGEEIEYLKLRDGSYKLSAKINELIKEVRELKKEKKVEGKKKKK